MLKVSLHPNTHFLSPERRKPPLSLPRILAETMIGHPKSHLGLALISIFLIAASATPLSIAPTPPKPSVYDILTQFGLPRGLLPDSVKSYSLSENGEFVVSLEGSCYIQFDYFVYYEASITGTLKYGSITNLKGIEVQRFFLWFDVDEIKVDLPPSNSIYFLVGFINKKLDVQQFQTIRSCGKGVSVSCRDHSKQVLQLPDEVDEMQKLMAE